MPTYPLTAFDQTTRRLPPATPNAGLANAFLGAVCTSLRPLEVWSQFQQSVGLGQPGLYTPALQEALGFWCQDPPLAFPSVPAIAAPPVWDYGGTSFGSWSGVLLVGQDPTDYSQIISAGGQWDCSQNIGLPVTGIRFLGAGGGTFAYFVRCRRADGSEQEINISAGISSPEPDRVIIQSVQISNCDPTQPPPIRPGGAQYPPPVPGSTPPPVPQFPINIELPQLPGWPALVIPVTYIPITPRLSLEPTLEFRPTINLPGLPAFSPNIEIGSGGLTIGGNGGDLTIGDLIDIAVEGGGSVECPDPCTPVDYEQIRMINFEELDSKFPPSRPNSLVTSIQPPATSATLILPQFTQWIELKIIVPPANVRQQSGGDFAQDVSYNGWYSFGATEEASERIPFHYDSISIRIPEGISAFSYTVYGSGTAQATVGYLLPG